MEKERRRERENVLYRIYEERPNTCGCVRVREREREREKGNEKIGRKFYKNNHGGGGRDRTIWI